MVQKFKRSIIKKAKSNRKKVLTAGKLARTKLSTRKYRKHLSSARRI